MEKNYRLVFSGEVVEGQDKAVVQMKLAILLKKDREVIDKLFSDGPKVLRKNVDRATCEKMQELLRNVGAITVIEEIEQGIVTQEATMHAEQIESETKDENNPDHVIKSSNSQGLFQENDQPKKSVSNRLDVAAKISSAKDLMLQSKSRGAEHYREAKGSLEHDLNVGGFGKLVKNNYFKYFFGAGCLLLLICLIFVIPGKNAMPLNQQNLKALANHIVFIEQSFTIEGLEKNSKNQRDYLGYLLIDPIDKMGFDFADTLEDITENYLDDDFSKEEEKLISPFLKIAAQERIKLQNSGIIEESLGRKLEVVTVKLAK